MLTLLCVTNQLLISIWTLFLSSSSLPPFFSISLSPSLTSFLFSFPPIWLTVMRSDCLSDSGQFYYLNPLLKPHPLSLCRHTNQTPKWDKHMCAHTRLYLCTDTHTHTHTILTQVDGTHGCTLSKQTHRFGHRNRERNTWTHAHTHTLVFLCALNKPNLSIYW